MATNRIKKRDNPYTQVSNSFLRDKNISFKAKGLFCYMFSMSEEWNFTLQSIAKQQNEGIGLIQSAMKELKEFGYISYEKHSDGTGTYTLDDNPYMENPNVENPYMENGIVLSNNNPKEEKDLIIKIDKIISPEKIVNYSESSFLIANLLLDNILSINPSFKTPKIEMWCKDIDKAMRIDGRTEQQLINCINWIYSPKGQFWQKNILSGAKLREKFDTMNMQVISKPTNQKDTIDDIYARGLTATEVIAEMVRREENK